MSGGWTPGPWSIDRHPAMATGSEWHIEACGTPNRASLARVYSLYCDGGGERRANANLIAAAPELYNACIQSRKFWEFWDDDCGMARILDAALAKARGETQ